MIHWVIIQGAVSGIGAIVSATLLKLEVLPTWAVILVFIGFLVLAWWLAKRFGSLCGGF